MLRHALGMLQSAAANIHRLIRTFPTPQPPGPSDPIAVMRREMKLLLIQIELLRSEVEHLRALEDQGRQSNEMLLAQLKQLVEDRDHWQEEAEHLTVVMGQVPPWLLFCSRCALKARQVISAAKY